MIDSDTAETVTTTLEENLKETLTASIPVNRRTVLGGLSIAGSAALAGVGQSHAGHAESDDHAHGNFGSIDEYGTNEFDPHEFLTTFNTGESGQDDLGQEVYEENGTTVRHYQFTAVNTPITIVPGVEFDAWAFNGQVPGPTIRATEGDIIRITFNNLDRHAHTIHPHLRNLDPRMDGVPQNGPGVIEATDDPFTYEWQAKPAGVHLYHCHSLPLKEHIHRGLYGTVIVDPDPERVEQHPRDYVNYHGPITNEFRSELVEIAKSRNHEYPENDDVNEMVMVMNGFDTNFDGDNEVYAVNTRAFAYGVGRTDGNGNWEPGETKRPIEIEKNTLQRVYVVNTIEFDPINSFHTHSQFFDYYDHGTTLLPTYKNIDTVMQCQAQRGILEIDYSEHQPGLYMFHAHQSEFAELGWMSFFHVTDQ